MTHRDDALPNDLSTEPTLSDRVVARVGARWSDKSIAVDLGMTLAELRRDFAEELKHGREKLQGIMLDQLLRRMNEGSVTAISKLRDVTGVAPGLPKSPDGEGVVPAGVGKKQARSMGAALAVKSDPDLRPN